VLVDQEAEILDGDLCRTLRDSFSDPEVAIVGCAGARNPHSMAWWESEEVFASSRYRCAELDGEYMAPLLSDGWSSEPRGPEQLPAEVDTVDGMLMALSPWAVRNLRFDESLGPRHGYDFDLCRQARAAGRKLLVADLAVAQARPLGVVKDPEVWIEAHMRVAEKWDADVVDWRSRARRAEGKAAAARLLSASKMYEVQALAWAQERELRAATSSVSWRVTAPLRQVARAARAARARRGARAALNR